MSDDIFDENHDPAFTGCCVYKGTPVIMSDIEVWTGELVASFDTPEETKKFVEIMNGTCERYKTF